MWRKLPITLRLTPTSPAIDNSAYDNTKSLVVPIPMCQKRLQHFVVSSNPNKFMMNEGIFTGEELVFLFNTPVYTNTGSMIFKDIEEVKKFLLSGNTIFTRKEPLTYEDVGSIRPYISARHMIQLISEYFVIKFMEMNNPEVDLIYEDIMGISNDVFLHSDIRDIETIEQYILSLGFNPEFIDHMPSCISNIRESVYNVLRGHEHNTFRIYTSEEMFKIDILPSPSSRRYLLNSVLKLLNKET